MAFMWLLNDCMYHVDHNGLCLSLAPFYQVYIYSTKIEIPFTAVAHFLSPGSLERCYTERIPGIFISPWKVFFKNVQKDGWGFFLKFINVRYMKSYIALLLCQSAVGEAVA